MAQLTSTFVLTAKLSDIETFVFHYDCPHLETALDLFWHDDYPRGIIDCDNSGCFPIEIIAMPDMDGMVEKVFHFEFNSAAFDHYFDKGWSASSKEPGQRYTFDQFLKDITPAQQPEPIDGIITKFVNFCFDYPHDFIEQIAWNCDTRHLRQKFDAIYDEFGSRAAVTTFYKYLSSDNRSRLAAYIRDVYKG